MIHLHHGWVVAVLVVATFPLIYYLLAIFAALAFSRTAKAPGIAIAAISATR